MAATAVSRSLSSTRVVAAERDRMVEARRLQRRLIVASLEVESAQRAYLLTGSAAFGNQITAAISLADTVAAQLLDSLRGEPRLASLARRGVQLFRLRSAQALEVVRQGGTGRGQRAPAASVMSPLQDSLRAVLVVLERELDARRAVEIEQLFAANSRTVRLVWLLGVAVLALVVLSLVALALTARTRRAALLAQAERDQAVEAARRKAAEAERLELEAQLRQSQKMEAVGQLTSGIAHDFNNILAVVLTSAELASQRLPPDDDQARSDLEALVKAGRRGRDLIRRMMAFSRRQELVVQPVEVAPLLTDFRETLSRLLPSSITVSVACREDIPAVAADPAALMQILLNVATNARDAMPEGGRITLSAEPVEVTSASRPARDLQAGSYVRISVADTGVGMDAAMLERAFEPFFTTKPAGRGTGLGLMMVAQLMRELAGHVSIASEPGRGTTVSLLLQVASRAAQADRAPAPKFRALSDPDRLATILIAEDDAQLRSVLGRVLAAAGYRVLAAADGREALQIAKRELPELVVSDFDMPGMSGADLCKALCGRPGAPRFILTSGSDSGEQTDALDGRVRLVPKPWTIEEMLRAVRDSLAEGEYFYAS